MPSPYRDLFASFQPDHDPSEIEEVVRQQYGSLGHLDRETLKREAALAAAVITSRSGRRASGTAAAAAMPPREFHLQGTRLSEFTLDHIEKFIANLPGSDPKVALSDATSIRAAYVDAQRKAIVARIAEEEAAAALRRELVRVGEYITSTWSAEEIDAAERRLGDNDQRRAPPEPAPEPVDNGGFLVSVAGKDGEYVFESTFVDSKYGFRVLRNGQPWIDDGYALKGSRAIDALACDLHEERATLAVLEERMGDDPVGREVYQWSASVQRKKRALTGFDVSVCGNKYTFRLPPADRPDSIESVRYGEPWTSFEDHPALDAIRALAENLHDTRAAIITLEHYFANSADAVMGTLEDEAPSPS